MTRLVSDHERRSVLVEIQGIFASRDEQVSSFRQQVLHGSLWPPQKIDAWIQRQAAEDGPPGVWLHDMPVMTVYPDNAGGVPRGAARLLINPPVSVAEITQVRAHWLCWYGDSGSRDLHQVPTAPDGVLERLRSIAEHLHNTFGWSHPHAVVFVLSGALPPIEQATATRPAEGYAGAITLTVDWHLSPREVGDVYRAARARLLGKRPRELDRKHLMLARFYAEEGEPPRDLRALMARWNQEYPQWAFKRYANFVRDARTSLERLLGSR